MSDSIDALLSKQSELFGFINRALANLEKLEIRKRTHAHGNMRVQALDTNWKKFQSNHDLLCTLKDGDKAKVPYFSTGVYAQCQEAYFDNRVDMVELIESWTPARTALTVEPSRQAPTSQQLPRIDLPKFSGSSSEWSEFCDLFKSMVSNNGELSNVEKLQYLKTSLTGEASLLLRNISVTGDNFARAWDTLVKRYENKRILIDSHLSSLFSPRREITESAADLTSLLNETEDALGALESLCVPAESWDHSVVYITTRKLDSESFKDWELKIGAETEPPKFDQLRQFLISRIRALEAVEQRTGSRKPKQIATAKASSSGAKVHQTNVDLARANSANENGKFSSVCSLCNATHYILMCPSYRAKTNEQRRALIAEKKLCSNCLGAHYVKTCKSLKRCQICAGLHHTTIHQNVDTVASASVTSSAEEPSTSNSLANPQPGLSHEETSNSQSEKPISSNVAHFQQIKNAPVLLATALVKVTSYSSVQYEVRALLDQGSEVSFVSESLAQRVNHPRERVSLPINGIGGQRSTVCRGRVALTIASRIKSDFSLSINAYILSKLTSYLPPVQVQSSSWPHLKGLSLADPRYANSIPIDRVLGAEVYSAIIEEGLKKGNPDSPVVQKTALGWILSGSVASHSENSQVFANGLQCSVDHELSDLLQRFWLQKETKSPRKSLLSKEDAQCEQQFEETHSRTLDGRYVVRLPIKTLPEELGDSRNAAQLTLARQEKRFTGNPKLKDAYSKFLAEYESLGHMQQISPSFPEPRRVFYLPHHAVLREHSTTTKVRVVFNGSYRTDRGISVNDLQYVGPKLQLDLADVITRWRQYGYVFIADIEKMYRQIRVHPNDWDLQRILWRADPEHPLSAHHLCTVTYGLTSAPYLALRTLQQLSTDENYRFPLATEIIQSEIYVDDVLSGAHELSKAKEKLRHINDCLKAGGFVLQKWASNDDVLLSEISSEHKETSSVVSIDDESPLRTLGILWQPRSDSFLFSSPRFSEHSRLTKRAVLSKIAQLFDPLGWIAPVVISGKIFMQQLWKSALEWDGPIKGKFANDWKNYEESLNDLSQISVPRWFGPRKRDSFVEIHGFADASQAALGAVIYLRIVSDFNDIRVSLVMAKTKVALLKKLTTPRLELSAAVLLTRQISRVREVLNLADAPTYLWTDSTVTLAYIHEDAYRWAEFVQNRVTVIKELENSRWQHVPGNQNPADLASRGVSPRQLATENLWWMGPTWLSKHSTAWPSTTPPLDPDVTFEIRKTQAYFDTELRQLKKNSQISRSSALIRLVPFLDDAGLIRVGGRIRQSMYSHDEKHPLILPRNSTLTTLVIDQAHRSTLHGGTQVTLATLRHRYWIVGGRVPIRAFIHNCVICIRYRAAFGQQLLGQLPPSRFACVRPFLHTGVDLAGPITLRTFRGRGAKTYKGYIVVFVCFSSSAVHLELVTDYSTAAFIAAFKRFSSRRGICETMTSDCGTNFVGAATELKTLFKASSKDFAHIASVLANDGTLWKFNPLSAPHFGGKWEAAVKSVKFHIKRVIGDTGLTYEEYSTLLTQIEAVLNSRPLCALSDNPSDLSALTPGHFLIGTALNSIPEPSLIDLPSSRLSRWQLLRQMLEHFWQRWSIEYIQQLQVVSKWQNQRENFKIGALVLVKDERYPPPSGLSGVSSTYIPAVIIWCVS